VENADGEEKEEAKRAEAHDERALVAEKVVRDAGKL
jgi:hypothetical protein